MAETATFTFTLDAALRSPEDVLRALVRQFADDRTWAEIERAVRKADDPSVVRVPHEEAAARLRQQRSGMGTRIGVRRAG